MEHQEHQRSTLAGLHLEEERRRQTNARLEALRLAQSDFSNGLVLQEQVIERAGVYFASLYSMAAGA